MAAFSGPEINEENLVFSLDSFNPKSFTRGNSAWKDVSGKGNNASLVNSPRFNVRKRVILDGINSYISVPGSSSTNIRGSLTVAMWAKSNHSSSTGWNTYWSGVSKYSQFILGPNGINGKMAFLVYSGTWYPTNYSSAIWGQTDIDPREYHYYVGVYDQSSGVISLYVDGVVEYSSNIGTRTLNNDTGGFTIGKREVSSHYLNAEIPKVEIYNRALSADEISRNFQTFKNRYIEKEINLTVFGSGSSETQLYTLYPASSDPDTVKTILDGGNS